jgi:CubicO group peptidase (beta-lactamase class C family)
MKKLLTHITLCATLALPVLSIAEESPTRLGVAAAKRGFTSQEAYDLGQQFSMASFVQTADPAVYAYLNLNNSMLHATIPRAGQVSELDTSIDASVLDFVASKGDVKRSLRQLLDPNNNTGQAALIIHKGKIIAESYTGMREYDNHVWMSNAKVVAGLLIAMLEEEGKIDVEQSVSTYWPAMKRTAWDSVRVIDALNMSSGLDLLETPKLRVDPNSGINRFYMAEVYGKGLDGSIQTHDQQLAAAKSLRPAGEVFEYSSAVTQALGRVIEEVENRPLADIISQRIWQHMGAEGDGQLALSPHGNGIVHGLISSRLRDMGRFALLFTPSAAVVSDTNVVTPAILEKIRSRANTPDYMGATSGPQFSALIGEQPSHNSYQWDAIFSDGDMYKAGMNGQGIYISPSRDLVIVYFSTGFGDMPIATWARQFAKTVPLLGH